MRWVAGWFMLALAIVSAASFAPAARAQTGGFPVAPEDCLIEPVADLQAGEAGDLATPSPTPTPVSVGDGTPADQAVVAAVTERIAQAIACRNAGDPLRMLANFTERWMTERFSGYDLVFLNRFQEAASNPEPLPADERIELLAVADVLLQEDGSVIAAVMTQVHGEEQSSLVVLVEDDGVWLIDAGDVV